MSNSLTIFIIRDRKILTCWRLWNNFRKFTFECWLLDESLYRRDRGWNLTRCKWVLTFLNVFIIWRLNKSLEIRNHNTSTPNAHSSNMLSNWNSSSIDNIFFDFNLPLFCFFKSFKPSFSLSWSFRFTFWWWRWLTFLFQNLEFRNRFHGCHFRVSFERSFRVRLNFWLRLIIWLDFIDLFNWLN